LAALAAFGVLALPSATVAAPSGASIDPILAPTLTDLKALQKGAPMVQTQGYSAPNDGGGGFWMWVKGDQSANITMDPRSALWAASASDSTGASGAWKRVDAGTLNALWFGCKGDGATDDTTALQAAFDYANRKAQTLCIPPGTYLLTSPISLTSGFYEVQGGGIDNTIISCAGVTGGGIVAASGAGVIRFRFRDFYVKGDSSTGRGIDFANVGNDLQWCELRNVRVLSGGNGIHIPNNEIFSSVFDGVKSESYNGHSFLVSCGPGMSFRNCYAMMCGTSKAGYRLAGQITMISCNGLNTGDFWGVFGSNTSASDGFQDDFGSTDYPQVTMIGCNVEDWAVLSTTASAIRLVNGPRFFEAINTHFLRGSYSTSYHSVVRATGVGPTGASINLGVSFWDLGTGTITGAALYTYGNNHFVDTTGTLAGAGVTVQHHEFAAGNYNTLQVATSIVGAGVARTYSSLMVGAPGVGSQSLVLYCPDGNFAGLRGINQEDDRGFFRYYRGVGGQFGASGKVIAQFRTDQAYTDVAFQSAAAVAPPQGGSATCGIKASSTADLGIYFGTGAPTFSAAKGSIYSNTTATTTTTRLYVNTDGGTGWASLAVSA
jgi:hypothetical protein